MSDDLPCAVEPRFEGRTILFGITGGIAAFKACLLASAWTQRGARVRVLMTPAATRFVTPLTFQSLTRQPVATDIWQAAEQSGYRPEHIEYADADLAVVAPATADFLARAAQGLANDILTVTLLAYPGPLVLAPAMNDRMWRHPAVEANLATLVARGAIVVPPDDGHLACGSVGAGRLAALSDIDAAISEQLGRLQ